MDHGGLLRALVLELHEVMERISLPAPDRRAGHQDRYGAPVTLSHRPLARLSGACGVVRTGDLSKVGPLQFCGRPADKAQKARLTLSNRPSGLRMAMATTAYSKADRGTRSPSGSYGVQTRVQKGGLSIVT